MPLDRVFFWGGGGRALCLPATHTPALQCLETTVSLDAVWLMITLSSVGDLLWFAVFAATQTSQTLSAQPHFYFLTKSS